MFGGLTVVVENRWPQDHIGHEVYSYQGHSFWRWLWPRLFRHAFPVTMERGRRLLRDIDPLLAGNRIICSPRQYHELKAAIAAVN